MPSAGVERKRKTSPEQPLCISKFAYGIYLFVLNFQRKIRNSVKVNTIYFNRSRIFFWGGGWTNNLIISNHQ